MDRGDEKMVQSTVELTQAESRVSKSYVTVDIEILIMAVRHHPHLHFYIC